MFKHEYENGALKKRLYEAEYRVQELTVVNRDQSDKLDSLEKHEYERETIWLKEIDKNKELNAKLEMAEEDLLNHKTTVLFGL